MNQRKIDAYIPYANEALRDAVEGTIAKHGVVCGVAIAKDWWNIWGWIPSNIPQLVDKFNESAQAQGFKVYFPDAGDSSIPQEILGDWDEDIDD
jgi:hypothetical protein